MRVADEYMNRSAVAKELGVTVAAVAHYKIPFIQYRKGSRVFYKKEDVEAFKKRSLFNAEFAENG
jgi:predicted transcriptional regulator